MPRAARVLAMWLGLSVGLAATARAQTAGVIQVSFDQGPSVRPSVRTVPVPLLPANEHTLANPIAFSPDTLAPLAPAATPCPPNARLDRRGAQFVFANLAPGEYLLGF